MFVGKVFDTLDIFREDINFSLKLLFVFSFGIDCFFNLENFFLQKLDVFIEVEADG